MVWVHLTVVVAFLNVAFCQSIKYPGCGCGCGPCEGPAPKFAATVGPTIAQIVVPTVAPTLVDGNVVQSLIDTIQLFVVSNLLADTLPEKKVVVPSPPVLDCGGDILQYEFLYDSECPDFITSMTPKCKCVCNMPDKCNICNDTYEEEYFALIPRNCVNCGLNKELILPPYAAELPCGCGYLPGGLPMVAKAFGPFSKGCGCSCGCGGGPGCPCSSAALPICSPFSCAALAVPLCPDMCPLVKPVIL